VAEWIVACDQPFNEVEKPEFLTMMNYAHHTGVPMNIPKRGSIKRGEAAHHDHGGGNNQWHS
jgi:hypothetical protein